MMRRGRRRQTKFHVGREKGGERMAIPRGKRSPRGERVLNLEILKAPIPQEFPTLLHRALLRCRRGFRALPRARGKGAGVVLVWKGYGRVEKERKIKGKERKGGNRKERKGKRCNLTSNLTSLTRSPQLPLFPNLKIQRKQYEYE